jgi:hypothetical protein
VDAKNSATLCDLHVFVDQPAKAAGPNGLDIVLDRATDPAFDESIWPSEREVAS